MSLFVTPRPSLIVSQQYLLWLSVAKVLNLMGMLKHYFQKIPSLLLQLSYGSFIIYHVVKAIVFSCNLFVLTENGCNGVMQLLQPKSS